MPILIKEFDAIDISITKTFSKGQRMKSGFLDLSHKMNKKIVASGCGSIGRCGRFLYQRSEVQSQSSANFCIGHLFVYCQLYWKDKYKEKEGRNDPFKSKSLTNEVSCIIYLCYIVPNYFIVGNYYWIAILMTSA